MASTTAKIYYQISPIILTGGIAKDIPGGELPMINLFGLGPTDVMGLPDLPDDLDQAFGAFNVLPGGTLITQSIGKYPFANQAVAANAVIAEPLTISLIMDAPMRATSNMPNLDVWAVKKAVFSALQQALKRHNYIGGMYSVATPAFVYDKLVMLNMTDNSRGNNSLPQNAWRFDFERPLIALDDIATMYNNFMNKISGQLPTTGALTGVSPGQGGADPTQAMTIKAAGALAGGAGSVPHFATVPAFTGFPYAGVS